ncbi:MAG: hypothetical protein HRU15_00465 [Planctomycetes bacterium]|nr:hypothetical protein [Planctomycetota bacterium]
MSLPPAIPPIAQNKNIKATTGAQNAPTEFTIVSEHAGRDLLSILKPGDQLSGRVVEQFTNGSYLFTVRGRNVIADSQTPLLRDSVVHFEVVSTKNGLHLRLDGPPQSDSVHTSNMSSRLQALNIPANQTSLLVLQQFEQLAAPLDRNRIQLAVQSLQQAPAQQHASLAASHALLASNQLPVTPAFIHLASHAVNQQGTQHNAALAQIQKVFNETAQKANIQSTHVTPNTNTNTITTGTSNVAPENMPADKLLSHPHTTSSHSTTQSAQQTANLHPLNIQDGSLQINAQHILQDMPKLQLNKVPDVQQMLAHNGIHPISTESITHNTPVAPTENEALNSTNNIAINAEATIQNEHALRSVVQELAHLSQFVHMQHNGGEILESINSIIQDMNADSFFKPQHLNDYDYVLPLLSQHNGEAQHARIAIANRNIPGQKESATFLRVDMELSQLGPLSLRMSSGQGPIIITIFATTPIVRTLSQALPQLEEDLQEQKLDAHIRIADLLDHQESSYV